MNAMFESDLEYPHLTVEAANGVRHAIETTNAYNRYWVTTSCLLHGVLQINRARDFFEKTWGAGIIKQIQDECVAKIFLSDAKTVGGPQCRLSGEVKDVICQPGKISTLPDILFKMCSCQSYNSYHCLRRIPIFHLTDWGELCDKLRVVNQVRVLTRRAK